MTITFTGLVNFCGCVFLTLLCATVGCFILCGIGYLKEQIDIRRWLYKIKRHFGILPTAKCYCVDCKYWNTETAYCCEFEKYTPDRGFCWGAKPRQKSEYDIHAETSIIGPEKKKAPYDYDKEVDVYI